MANPVAHGGDSTARGHFTRVFTVSRSAFAPLKWRERVGRIQGRWPLGSDIPTAGAVLSQDNRLS